MHSSTPYIGPLSRTLGFSSSGLPMTWEIGAATKSCSALHLLVFANRIAGGEWTGPPIWGPWSKKLGSGREFKGFRHSTCWAFVPSGIAVGTTRWSLGGVAPTKICGAAKNSIRPVMSALRFGKHVKPKAAPNPIGGQNTQERAFVPGERAFFGRCGPIVWAFRFRGSISPPVIVRSVVSYLK